MSGKIIPAMVAAILLAGTAVASAQAPSAEGAGDELGAAFSNYYSGYQGYYNFAPGPYGYGLAPGRNSNNYSPGSSATR